jgi:hypothetical protein
VSASSLREWSALDYFGYKKAKAFYQATNVASNIRSLVDHLVTLEEQARQALLTDHLVGFSSTLRRPVTQLGDTGFSEHLITGN